MSTIGPLILTVDSAAATASITALARVLGAVDGLAESLAAAGFGGLILCNDFAGLFRCESVDGAAAGAGVLHGMRIVPDERYLELVAAIVAQGNAYISGDAHGWPILSVVASYPSTVAEAGAETIGPGGGAAT